MIRRILRRLVLGSDRLPTFATPARGLVMQAPYQVENPERIHLGEDIKLGPDSALRAVTDSPGSWLKHPEGRHVAQQFSGEVHLGHRVTATGALQVIAVENITIEDDVMFARNIFLCDGLHGYERSDIPYKYQGIFRIAPIRIGRGSWIGQNVVVMPGVTIGELAIVGANSVVTRDIPPQAIAVGSPARVIRTWDSELEAWVAQE